MKKVAKKTTKKHLRKKSSFKKPLIFAVLLGLMLLLPLIILNANKKDSSQSLAHASSCPKVILPAYFYPSPPYTLWEQAISAASPNSTLSVMIVNPASGPGTFVDSNYVHVISRLRAAGIKPIGYITSSYAARTQAQMQAEVDAWNTMYGITEIFIDETTSDAGHIPYYATINDYIKSKTPGAMVVINPGTTVDEGYMNVADVVTLFEGSYNTYLSFQFPSWVQNYPSTKFLHLIYDVPSVTDMQSTLARSQTFNAGYVYITNDKLTPGHPWDTLPPYWTDEINALNANCTVATPTLAPGEPTPTQAAPTSTPTPTIGDTTPPTVVITNPVNGGTVRRNRTVTIRATATDNVSVTSVQFYVNGNLRCTDQYAAYTCKWDVPSALNVSYTITARATDAAGNIAESSVVVTSVR